MCAIHLPICPDSSKSSSMPLCHTIQMKICHMPAWTGPHAICPYGGMLIYICPYGLDHMIVLVSLHALRQLPPYVRRERVPRPIPETV